MSGSALPCRWTPRPSILARLKTTICLCSASEKHQGGNKKKSHFSISQLLGNTSVVWGLIDQGLLARLEPHREKCHLLDSHQPVLPSSSPVCCLNTVTARLVRASKSRRLHVGPALCVEEPSSRIFKWEKRGTFVWVGGCCSVLLWKEKRGLFKAILLKFWICYWKRNCSWEVSTSFLSGELSKHQFVKLSQFFSFQICFLLICVDLSCYDTFAVLYFPPAAGPGFTAKATSFMSGYGHTVCITEIPSRWNA